MYSAGVLIQIRHSSEYVALKNYIDPYTSLRYDLISDYISNDCAALGSEFTDTHNLEYDIFYYFLSKVDGGDDTLHYFNALLSSSDKHIYPSDIVRDRLLKSLYKICEEYDHSFFENIDRFAEPNTQNIDRKIFQIIYLIQIYALDKASKPDNVKIVYDIIATLRQSYTSTKILELPHDIKKEALEIVARKKYIPVDKDADALKEIADLYNRDIITKDDVVQKLKSFKRTV